MARHHHQPAPPSEATVAALHQMQHAVSRPPASAVRIAVDFSEARANDVLVAQGRAPVGAHVIAYDENGNECDATAEKIDERASLVWLRLDRSTWRSAVYA